ncbi:DUF1799 domain-containing protein [Pseudomonas fluorescens]|uniref:DUF1799 domain-containing protein n=1 Tax=Pseudomonas fluorescens TaxID=294 RepID=UPI00124305D5|nr:DUF1799 domain-containing protein [Pseudomonas fluorescens]
MISAARALYQPTFKGQDAFGFSAEDYSDEFEVWPDNWPAFTVFEAMSTQWRTGACGATGMDYGVLLNVMCLSGVPVKDRTAIFHDLRVMEAEALSLMSDRFP